MKHHLYGFVQFGDGNKVYTRQVRAVAALARTMPILRTKQGGFRRSQMAKRGHNALFLFHYPFSCCMNHEQQGVLQHDGAVVGEEYSAFGRCFDVAESLAVVGMYDVSQ